MRIGILSDTHGNLPTRVVEAFVGCDHVIHAGDVGPASLLAELEALAPVTAVLGNNDYSLIDLLNRHEEIELDGTRFLIAHTLDDLNYLLDTWQPGRPLPHVCIYGHTHVPREFTHKFGCLMINPGSLYGPRRGSAKQALILKTSDGNITDIVTVSL